MDLNSCCFVVSIFRTFVTYTILNKSQFFKARKRQRASTKTPDPGPSTSVQLSPDTPRKKILRKRLFQEMSKSKQKTRKIRALRQSLKRYKKKVICLKSIVTNLEKKNLIASEQAMLLENMSLINKQMLQRKSKISQKYTPELRRFAISLNFFSPKAYDYVRNVFDTCLPHSSTIGKWLQNINAAPGFTAEAFETLQKQVNYSQKPCICALIIDEMSIRQHLEWDGKNFHGYVNFGTEINDDRNQLAKEAFVLLIVCINGTWKLPVGYFLTNSLNGQQKHSIVQQCISLIENTGARVVSLTCDGPPSNISLGKLLGCSFEFPNIRTSFGGAGSSKKYFFLDPCHMIKLVRNTFGEKKVLMDEDGNIIDWRYIEALENLQQTEGLHLGNKLRKAHISFLKQKMKVRLAVQLLSESVADSLEYCEEKLMLREFQGCKATVRFIRIFNNIFDILNSRSLVSPGFKKPLCQKNIDSTTDFVNMAINYISQLKFANNELVIKSQRKTGFIGLIIGFKSSLQLYDDLVTKEKLIYYFPLYKISQDHLELFFSSVRSKGGWNNNPTARQFMGAYKRLLVRGEVREHGVGNCIPLDQVPVLVSSSRINVSDTPEGQINLSLPGYKENDSSLTDITSIWRDHEYLVNSVVLTEFSEQVVTYIAGFVIRHLQKIIKCVICVGALSGNKANFLNSLIRQKSHGGLMYPSKDVVKICLKAERCLRMCANLNKKHILDILTNQVLSDCLEHHIFENLNNHLLENPVNHKYFLVKSICYKYFNVRLHFIAKKESYHMNPLRQQMTKLILFKGQ